MLAMGSHLFLELVSLSHLLYSLNKETYRGNDGFSLVTASFYQTRNSLVVSCIISFACIFIGLKDKGETEP